MGSNYVRMSGECSQILTTPIAHPLGLTHHYIMLVPPPNFGMVEESLYRSGQPDQLNFPFLEKLGLKSVIWLAPEEAEVGLYVYEN